MDSRLATDKVIHVFQKEATNPIKSITDSTIDNGITDFKNNSDKQPKKMDPNPIFDTEQSNLNPDLVDKANELDETIPAVYEDVSDPINESGDSIKTLPASLSDFIDNDEFLSGTVGDSQGQTADSTVNTDEQITTVNKGNDSAEWVLLDSSLFSDLELDSNDSDKLLLSENDEAKEKLSNKEIKTQAEGIGSTSKSNVPLVDLPLSENEYVKMIPEGNKNNVEMDAETDEVDRVTSSQVTADCIEKVTSGKTSRKPENNVQIPGEMNSLSCDDGNHINNEGKDKSLPPIPYEDISDCNTDVETSDKPDQNKKVLPKNLTPLSYEDISDCNTDIETHDKPEKNNQVLSKNLTAPNYEDISDSNTEIDTPAAIFNQTEISAPKKDNLCYEDISDNESQSQTEKKEATKDLNGPKAYQETEKSAVFLVESKRLENKVIEETYQFKKLSDLNPSDSPTLKEIVERKQRDKEVLDINNINKNVVDDTPMADQSEKSTTGTAKPGEMGQKSDDLYPG